jgi:hypothetical protein
VTPQPVRPHTSLATDQRADTEHLAEVFCEAVEAGPLSPGRPPHHRYRQQGRSAGAGYDRVHVAIDDATRLAYVEVLADEQQATAIGFLTRAVPGSTARAWNTAK